MELKKLTLQEREEVVIKIHKIIINLIKSNKPVLLTGNLKELYYSSHYKEQDARHLFLIVGYDNEKKIY